MLAAIFVIQMVATTLCGTENAHAATTASLSHASAPMHCPMMDMHAPSKHGTTYCVHCHPPTFNQVADHVDNLTTTWMPIALLTPVVTPEQTATGQTPSARSPIHLHGPPRSTSLIYNTTQRIRV